MAARRGGSMSVRSTDRGCTGRLARRVAVLALALAFVAGARSGAQILTRLVYIETQTVTNGATKTMCTASSTPANCSTDVATTQGFCNVETNPIRWFANGTAPTTAVGHLANAGSTITLNGSHLNISNFRMIATGSNATVTCSVGRP